MHDTHLLDAWITKPSNSRTVLRISPDLTSLRQKAIWVKLALLPVQAYQYEIFSVSTALITSQRSKANTQLAIWRTNMSVRSFHYDAAISCTPKCRIVLLLRQTMDRPTKRGWNYKSFAPHWCPGGLLLRERLDLKVDIRC